MFNTNSSLLMSIVWFAVSLLGTSAAPSEPPQVSRLVDSDTAILSIGRDAGVQKGMTGSVISEETVGGQKKKLAVADFRVETVEAQTSEVQLTIGSGWTVEPGMLVEFDEALDPPTVATRPSARSQPPPQEVLQNAEAAFDRQDWETAEALYLRFLELEPSDLFALSRLERVRGQLAAVNMSARQLSDRAEESATNGQWKEAVRWYRLLLARLPGDPAATEGLQSAESELRKVRAEEAARATLLDRLPDADYVMEKGDEMAAKGNWEQAVHYYSQVAEIAPNYKNASQKHRAARGKVALEKARSDAELAISDMSSDTHAIAELKSAIATIERVGSLDDPDLPRFRQALAEIEARHLRSIKVPTRIVAYLFEWMRLSMEIEGQEVEVKGVRIGWGLRVFVIEIPEMSGGPATIRWRAKFDPRIGRSVDLGWKSFSFENTPGSKASCIVIAARRICPKPDPQYSWMCLEKMKTLANIEESSGNVCSPGTQAGNIRISLDDRWINIERPEVHETITIR